MLQDWLQFGVISRLGWVRLLHNHHGGGVNSRSSLERGIVLFYCEPPFCSLIAGFPKSLRPPEAVMQLLILGMGVVGASCHPKGSEIINHMMSIQERYSNWQRKNVMCVGRI